MNKEMSLDVALDIIAVSYTHLSLYSCIAYIVLSISLVVMQYGIEREIEILEYALRNEADVYKRQIFPQNLFGLN